MFNKFGIMVSALSLAVVAIVGCSYDKSAKSGSVKLRSPHGSAVVSLDGARILSWKDASGRELFFMPAKPYSPDGDWSHGGTSICWPWFGRKGSAQNMIHGFARKEAILTGAETRTSAPIRILRNNDTKLALGYKNLYPAGEGAGYAGGITSAAIDGLKCAIALMSEYKP